jgi:hypothetical protein
MRRIWMMAAALALCAGPVSAQIALPAPAPATAPADAGLLMSLDAIAARTPGQANVYVLAAGLWGDPVFDNESRQAAEILARRYSAQGKTVLMSNKPVAPASPLKPTPALLNEALTKLAAQMDKAEDVLLVFITSHGNKEGAAIRDMRGLDTVLSPAALRAGLDATGVRNRIVIISACHSGVFIPALQSPTTIVMTAASEETSSFGCEPENDWTWFGDAFFQKSLARGRTMMMAFNEARAQVTIWERNGRLDPSKPQIFIGAEAKPFLDAIEARAIKPASPAPRVAP